jgi:hypothetical protein
LESDIKSSPLEEHSNGRTRQSFAERTDDSARYENVLWHKDIIPWKPGAKRRGATGWMRTA